MNWGEIDRGDKHCHRCRKDTLTFSHLIHCHKCRYTRTMTQNLFKHTKCNYNLRTCLENLCFIISSPFCDPESLNSLSSLSVFLRRFQACSSNLNNPPHSFVCLVAQSDEQLTLFCFTIQKDVFKRFQAVPISTISHRASFPILPHVSLISLSSLLPNLAVSSIAKLGLSPL